MSEVQVSEARAFYGFQIAMENIHSEMYSLLIDTYIRDEEEKQRLFSAIAIIHALRKRPTWAIQWIHDTQSSFASRLVAFACVEGIFSPEPFVAFIGLRNGGKCRG